MRKLYKVHYFFEKNNSKNIFSRIESCRKIALFLDYDGTLAPIQKDPSRCILSNKIKSQLKLLAVSPKCYLTILSGRSLSDIRKTAGIKNICYGGNHGLDISGPNVRYANPKGLSARPLIIRIEKLLNKKIRNIKGAWLEDKKFTLSLHFRSVRKERIMHIKNIFYKTLEEFSEKNH